MNAIDILVQLIAFRKENFRVLEQSVCGVWPGFLRQTRRSWGPATCNGRQSPWSHFGYFNEMPGAGLP